VVKNIKGCKMLTSEQYNEIDKMYDYEIPEYIKVMGKTYITILVSDMITDKPTRLKITVKDVVRYYATQAPNIVSSLRNIAGYYGDWRMIDNLASECLAYFKIINRPMLQRESKKYGMELKS
jgi:hypothetical protein